MEHGQYQSPGSQYAGGGPPNKKQRMSTDPPQTGSPYNQSPYNPMNPNSPANGATAPAASTHFPNVGLPQGGYNTPYSNGHSSSGLSLPQSNYQNPQQNLLNTFERSNHLVSPRPNFNEYAIGAPPHSQGQNHGAMGPPTKPIDRKDDTDPMDVFSGTGVDLREEEQYTQQMFNNTYNSQPTSSQSGSVSAGHSFTQYPPGSGASFYGAGPANAAAGKADTEDQSEYEKKVADKSWADAAHKLTESRQQELNSPFLQVGRVHMKFVKATKGVGIDMKLDQNGSMGFMKRPEHFSHSQVQVQTAVGPDGILTTATGRFLPTDSMLVDQVALISIAAKHRIRGLLEDAHKIAKGRQTGAHGIVPEDWIDAAGEFPSGPRDSSIVGEEGGPRFGWESAVSPHTTSLKRPFSDINKLPTPPSDTVKAKANPNTVPNQVVAALRSSANAERDAEEIRLQKRNARAASTNATGTPSRQASIVPGTPGSIAPETPDKVPTKKEQKKKAEAKANEAQNHAAANVTTSQFLGKATNMWGKKKKGGPGYLSWLTGAGGSSTPGNVTPAAARFTPAADVPAAPLKLTQDGARRLGTHREDQDYRGSGIQLRDWIAVLKEDGKDRKSIQTAYASLDDSMPK